MRQLFLALQFLTILPVKVRGTVTETDISGSAVFFHVAGAFQGLLAACTALVSVNFFTSEIISFVCKIWWIYIKQSFFTIIFINMFLKI